MENELVVETQISLDKNDIVAVAVAEAEKKIRENIKSCRQRVSECESKMDELKDEYELIGQNMMEGKLAKRFKEIKTKIESLKLGLTAEIVFESNFSVRGNQMINNDDINTCAINIVMGKDDKSRTQIRVVTEKIKATAAQIKAHKQFYEVDEHKKQATTEGVNWQRKQSDIPALERQMRAQVAREEMNKSKTGRDIYKAMMNSLDDTIKMIGM